MDPPRSSSVAAPGGCSVEQLPGPPIARRGIDDRVGFLLQWMVGAAGADSGVLLLRHDAGSDRLPRHDAGSDLLPRHDDSPDLLPRHDASPDLVVRAAVGLDVAGASRASRGDGGRRQEGRGVGPSLHHRGVESDCEHVIVDGSAHAVMRVALESERRPLGEVQLGFRGAHSPADVELQRLQVIADHITAVIEAARHAEEVEARNLELEELNATLVGLDRMKGDFLSMVSHELRTPLTAIIGYTDLLLRGSHGALNDRQARHQHAVKKAAHRLLALVNDLLDVSRLESGRVALATLPLSLYDAARCAVGEVEDVARGKGVDLRLDAPMRSPWVRADPERLQQVLANLLDNALKFTPDGGRVTVHLERVADHAAVIVEDTGVGIPADQLDQIWDRFHQVDSSTRRHFGGTGLGLAIVRNLIGLHGGRVSVQSDGAGLGSRFSFTLPTVAAPEAIANDVQPQHLDSTRLRERRVILIVDDEPDNREVIATLVADDLGYETRSASNGEEALAAALARPDLILLDLRMPDLSGFEVARRLKADAATADIPLMAITALADDDDQRAAREAGCIGCVTKPFTPSSLTTAITRALNAAGAIGASR